jgi:sRNA-binding carbon storage regulator CsrA
MALVLGRADGEGIHVGDQYVEVVENYSESSSFKVRVDEPDGTSWFEIIVQSEKTRIAEGVTLQSGLNGPTWQATVCVEAPRSVDIQRAELRA